MHIPSFKLISQSMLKKSPENADGRTDGRTDGQTDGRTLPRHNTSRFSNGRIKMDQALAITQLNSSKIQNVPTTRFRFFVGFRVQYTIYLRSYCAIWNIVCIRSCYKETRLYYAMCTSRSTCNCNFIATDEDDHTYIASFVSITVTYGSVGGTPHIFFNRMLSHTKDLTSHPYDITAVMI